MSVRLVEVDGWVLDQLFEVLLKTLVTTHTEEENKDRVEDFDLRRPSGVSMLVKVRNLENQRNIQTDLSSQEERLVRIKLKND
jgi:hypothetical protein